MDSGNLKLACDLVSSKYIQQGSQALSKRHRLVKTLLSQRRLPEVGWDDDTVELLIKDAALMDSNNFLGNVGVGEREAKVACRLVSQRHYGLAHGMGRSGDIAAEQPKAAGSTMLAKLSNLLVADAMRIAGMQDLGPVTLLPLATGMAITVTLLALKAARPATARWVLWPRIDQKTCLKAIISAGLEVIVAPMLREGDQLRTDLQAVRHHIERLGPDNVVAVVSTTSCFAPRSADDVVELARLAASAGVGHIINNAYGVQSATLCRLITSAWRRGRVDAVVQSTDKNFMVPVGGAVVSACRSRPALVEAVNKAYPGRASMSPLLDVLMTLLHWGAAGWRSQLQQRENLYKYAQQQLKVWAQQHGERLLHTPENPISLALTLSHLESGLGQSVRPPVGVRGATEPGAHAFVQTAAPSQSDARKTQQPVTFLGSMLFSRSVSGTRVVARQARQHVAGHSFIGYGAHCDDYPVAYLTVAAALGTTQEDIDEFLKRLTVAYAEFKLKHLQQD